MIVFSLLVSWNGRLCVMMEDRMEGCEENDVTPSSKATYGASQDKTNGDSNADKNTVKTRGDHGLDNGLDQNLLLALFGGNAENVEYYCQLQDLACHWNENDQGPLICDPRDLRKVKQNGSWRPKTRTEDLRDLLKQCNAENLAFASRQMAIELDTEDGLIDDRNFCDGGVVQKDTDLRKSFQCGVQGCCEVFTSLALHEAHYRRCHSYACATCRRSFVSSFLLDVHAQENHDSYFQILSTRIDMYRCLVETCSSKFRTADLRKDHMITEHKFPSNFSFHQPLKEVNVSPTVASDENKMDLCVTCPDGQSGGHKAKSQTDAAAKKVGPDKNTEAKKGPKKSIPSTVCFGRGSQRAFQRQGRGARGRHWHQTAKPDVDTTVDLESVDMKDLAESLS